MNNKLLSTLFSSTLVATLSLPFMQAANAEYVIKIPMEVSNGGTLPNESIVIKDANTDASPEEPEEESSNNYIVLNSGGSYNNGVPENGQYSWSFVLPSQVVANTSPLRYTVDDSTNVPNFSGKGEMSIKSSGLFTWSFLINPNNSPPDVTYFEMPATAVIKENGLSIDCSLTQNELSNGSFLSTYYITYTCNGAPEPSSSISQMRQFRIEFK